jgi:hypothetical protein
MRRNAVPQCHAVQKLHGDERTTIMLADLVDCADIRMVQGRSCTGFAAETLQCLRILRHIFGEKLQRDEAPKLGVLSLVDHAHAAAAEFLDNAVVRDGLADHQKILGFRAASSYGRGIRESTKGSCGTVASNHSRMVGYTETIANGESAHGLKS